MMIRCGSTLLYKHWVLFVTLILNATNLSAEPIPEQFSEAYLSGKTFYWVWFGTGVNAQGNEIDDVAAVVQAQFQNNGNVILTGIENSNENFTASWSVDAEGLLIVGGESGSGNKIACEHTDQFIRTHYLEDGVFDNVDLFFFEREAAETYAATLTESIPPCAAGPGFHTIPTASISVDGDSADWAGIDPVATDPAGDQAGSDATDFIALYAATDGTRFSLMMQVSGAITMPHTPAQQFSHYEVGLHYHSDLGCQDSLANYQIANNYTDQSGANSHHLDTWAYSDPSGSLSERQTVTGYAGNRLETSFSLDEIPDDARSMRFGPYTQSFGPLGNPLSHDEAASDCYLLPVLGDDRKKRILLYQRVLQSLPK